MSWTILVERKNLEKNYQKALEKLQSRCPHKRIIPPFFSGGYAVCMDCGKMVKWKQKRGGDMLEIGKCYVDNCFELGKPLKEVLEESAIKGQDRGNSMVELENGIWLESMNDGRYYKDDDEFSRWAEVLKIGSIDEEGNIESASLVGFIEL